MKTLAALVTALALLGFGGAAFAECAGHMKTGETAQNDKRILPPGEEAAS